MLKSIKKSIKYFIIVTGVIVLLPTILITVLQIPEFQTLLVKRITQHFSKELKSTVSIGKMEYKFFNKLSVNDILIKDKNNDTLFYSKRANAGFKIIDIKNGSFRIGRVTLVQPIIKVITDSTGVTNLSWYLDLLKKPADSTKVNSGQFSIDQIDISDARFDLINKKIVTESKGMDFNNLRIEKINGIIEELSTGNDTTRFRIYNLAFTESSGFRIKRMNSNVILAKHDILLASTFLNCDSSVINLSKLEIKADSSGSFKNFIEEVRLNITMEKSLINSSDLQYFIPSLIGLNESIWFSGKILGTVSELRGRNIEISYRDYTSLSCDFDFSGLPKIDNAFIYIGVSKFKTNALDLEKITLPEKGKLILPAFLYNSGNISFNGSFTGFTTDFVTYGNISSSIGNINTDISLRPEKSGKYILKGIVTGKEIDLGTITSKPDLFGKVNLQTNVDGYAYSLKSFAVNLTGKADSVEFNRYNYRNITLNGMFTEKTWDGSIKIADKNIKLDLLGLLNFRNKLPEFDFTLSIADANLSKLNFDKTDTTSRLTILLTSNFKGNSIDNLDGEIRLLNSSFIKYGTHLELYDFSLKAYNENRTPVLSLRTDFMDGDLRGKYNFAELGGIIKSTMARLMPSQFKIPVKPVGTGKNNFTFNINFKNTDRINNFLRTGIILANKSSISGGIFPDSAIYVTAKAASISVKNNLFSDFSFEANVKGSELNAKMATGSLSVLNQSELKAFNIGLSTVPDNFTFNLGWDSKEHSGRKENFTAKGFIEKSQTGKKNTILRINIDSTEIYSGANKWKIRQSDILIDSNTIAFNKISLESGEHSYLIDGTISENPADTLLLELGGINIKPLNYLVNQKNINDPTALQINFNGIINGKILLSNVYHDLLLVSNIVVSDFSMLGSKYGDLSIVSELDVSEKIINISAGNNLAGVKMLDIKGFYNPSLKKINLDFNASKLHIEALNPLLKAFASEITGTTSGKVNLTGEPGRIILKGALMAENASMKIDYLQTRYRMNDTVRFDKSGIKFNSIKLLDEKGNVAVLSGAVNHKNFKEYTADVIVKMDNDCLVLNTKPKDNSMFYGTAYASGVVTIKSTPSLVSFDISAKSGKNTKFFIPLTSGLSVSEYSFISFINPKAVSDSLNKNPEIQVKAAPKKTAMELNCDLEITPDAEVQLIFDSKVGDVMKGHGSGNLNINLSKKGEFKMIGDYVIEDGDYLFTLGNLFNKPFTVDNGGKVIFKGDLDNAEIDVKAIYRNLKASLYPIIPEERFKERIPVEPQLTLTGKLFNPTVKFDIYLPNADEETRSYLRNSISTEEELNRQIFALLIGNSFIAIGPTADNSTSAAGTSAMRATTFEMLSNQLSNWLSQMSNNFNIGFNYRPGSGSKDINPEELQLALSTQLLNNKILLNTNFDVRGASSSTANPNQITGDFDAEIKLTEKIRFKVFNRYNELYTIKGLYTQGIGIFYKQDFDKFSDLFKKKQKSEMKKEEDVKPVEK